MAIATSAEALELVANAEAIGVTADRVNAVSSSEP